MISLLPLLFLDSIVHRVSAISKGIDVPIVACGSTDPDLKVEGTSYALLRLISDQKQL